MRKINRPDAKHNLASAVKGLRFWFFVVVVVNSPHIYKQQPANYLQNRKSNVIKDSLAIMLHWI